MSTITVTEQAVRTAAGDSVRVRWEDPTIAVRWPCGDARHFTPEEALDTIAHVRASAEEHPGTWMVAKDHNGFEYAVMIDENDELYADTRPRDMAGQHLPWKDLRRAVRRAAKEHRDDS